MKFDIRRSISERCRRAVGLPLGVLLALTFVRGASAEDVPDPGPRSSLRFSSEPEYDLRPGVERFDARHVPYWLLALERPENELLRNAAEAFIDARSMGYDEVDPQTVPRLRAALGRCTEPVARRAVAKALIAYDDRSAADDLWKSCETADQELRRIVSPALGRWGFEPAITANLEILNDPLRAIPVTRLAVEVLRQARWEPARQRLLELVTDVRLRGDLRLASAGALGEIADTGLTSVAESLQQRSRGDDPWAGLLAARLLDRHGDEASIALLRQLAQDESTAVQSLALDRLRDLRPELAAAFALEPETAPRYSVTHPDANVRRVLIEAVFAVRRGESIPVLTAFLDDPHPENRTVAADGLYAIARINDELLTSVKEHAAAALDHSSWRVLERASLVIAGLDHEPAADKLLGLLRHPRGEVGVATAYALKELAVPATLPGVLEQLQRQAARDDYPDTDAGRAERRWVARQSEQLCEQLGSMDHAPADPTLRLFIPKSGGKTVKSVPLTRGTAIWALGRIHQGTSEPELAALLIERLLDVNPFNPEFDDVREASAYALGWMKSTEAAEPLKQFADRSGLIRSPGTACAWGLEQVTGEVLPLPGEYVHWRAKDWFLRSAETPP